MKITKVSQISGKEHTIEIPMDEDAFNKAIIAWHNGAYIQDAFPMLSAAQREFIMTGITEEEWDETFKEEDDEEPVEGDFVKDENGI